MLLFLLSTDDDVVKVFDLEKNKEVGTVDYALSKWQGIGPKSAVYFGGGFLIAGSYNNKISMIDRQSLLEKTAFSVGKYPTSLLADANKSYVACGDSNSIWTISSDFEVRYVDATVEFPISMAMNRDTLAVGGYNNGEICLYSKSNLQKEKSFFIDGNPVSLGYLKDRLVIGYGNHKGGFLMIDKDVFRLGNRINKVKVFCGGIYACVDEKTVIRFDENNKTVFTVRVNEPIFDIDGNKDFLVMSMLISGDVVVINEKGAVKKRIATEKGGYLFLLP